MRSNLIHIGPTESEYVYLLCCSVILYGRNIIVVPNIRRQSLVSPYYTPPHLGYDYYCVLSWKIDFDIIAPLCRVLIERTIAQIALIVHLTHHSAAGDKPYYYARRIQLYYNHSAPTHCCLERSIENRIRSRPARKKRAIADVYGIINLTVFRFR